MEVALLPFLADASIYDARIVEVDKDATCGDIVRVLAEHLHVDTKKLSLVGRKASAPVRFHLKEKPISPMFVKGVKSLADVPTDLFIRSQHWREALTLEEGLAIQKALIEAYTDKLFVKQMHEARAECRRKWRLGGMMETKDYNNKMRPILESAQQKVLPKWGYDANFQGMMRMQAHFIPIDPEPEVMANLATINHVIGNDFVWINQERNFGTNGKLKMLFLYGGGTNAKVARMQLAGVFRESPMRENIEWDVLEAPTKSDLSWHASEAMRAQLAPFGSDIFLYFDRVPFSNAQDESWPGIEASLEALSEQIANNGPYDGVCGFNMGGEVLLQAARLAQAGVPRYRNMFRFMVLFTTSTPRHLSALGQGGKRFSAPLDIPAVISYSHRDESQPYMLYEETALHFGPDVREVIVHDFGHVPPPLKKGTDQLDRLSSFLDAMWKAMPWKPSDHPDNDWNRRLRLPLPRDSAMQFGSSSPSSAPRRLLVVPDPMGAHDYPNLISFLEECLSKGVMQRGRPTVPYKSQGLPDQLNSARMYHRVSTLGPEVFAEAGRGRLTIEAVEYSDAQRSHNWHVPGDSVPSEGPVRVEDTIAEEEHDRLAEEWARELIARRTLTEQDHIGIVGLGTGAFLAFAIARLLIREGASKSPAGLWLVDPPTRLPFQTTREPGVLGNCPVRVLNHSTCSAGPPWRWEVASVGPFAMSVFARVDEMASIVVSEYLAMLDGRATWTPLGGGVLCLDYAPDASEALARRCADELNKKPVMWAPVSLDVVRANCEKRDKGMIYGLEFPWNEELLEAFGPKWLTQAFHATGVLDKANSVTDIIVEKTIKVTAGNNAGKFLFEVRYAREAPGLHTQLFAKIPFPLADKTKSDRLSSSVNKQPQEYAEINTYRLLESTIPAKIPKYYYGDISCDSTNWVLITERVNFHSFDGMNFGPPPASRPEKLKPFEIEGPYDKCVDYNLRGEPEEYYLLLTKTGARMAGLYKAGKMGSQEVLNAAFQNTSGRPIEAWGMNPGGPTGENPKMAKAKMDQALTFFSDTGKVLYPDYVKDEAFLTKFRKTMMTLQAYAAELNFWKNNNPDYVALTHQNLNVDNAYFWRDADGKLDLGVFDWGGMGASSLGHKMWWWVYCTDFPVFQANLPKYIDCFVASYKEAGGPELDKETMTMMTIITAMEQMVGLMAAVPQIYRMCPKKEWPTIKDRYDSRISENIDGKSTLRLYLHVQCTIIRIIEEMKGDEVLQKWIQDVYVEQFNQKPKTDAMIGL